jgi:hypothetical protein
MEKMLHTQPVPRLGMAQQFAGVGLKITTDMAGMLGRLLYSRAPGWILL